MRNDTQWHKRWNSAWSVLLILAMLLGMVPGGVLAAETAAAEAIKVDFKEFALEAAESGAAWWQGLQDTDVEGIKRIGASYGSVPTDEEYAAFRAMQAALDAEGVWNIEEGSPAFDDEYNGRSIYLNTTGDDYGLRFYPSILQAEDDRDRLILSVQAAAAGLYHFDLTVLNEASSPSVAQVNGTMGRAYGNVYVNDELVYENYFFAADTDTTVTLSFGAVELQEGKNTVAIEVTRDDSGLNTTSRRAFNLKSMEFIPLNGVQAELGRTMTLDLRTTYLTFDAAVSSVTHQVESSDSGVASAAFEADGDLVITAYALGETTLTVTSGGTEVCSIPVAVVEATTPDDGANYMIDGFKAELVTYGHVAEGNVSWYAGGAETTEEEIKASGAVYFTSSDKDVAQVDLATGDVTCVGEGIAVIMAYVLLDGIVYSDQVIVTVTDDTDLAEITLDSAVDYVGVGNDLQLALRGKKASGANADMSRVAVSYTTGDVNTAVVSDSGRVTGVAPGTVTVTASVGVEGQEVSDSLTVEVVENSALAGDDVLLDFTDGRVLDLQTATLEDDGVALVLDACYNGGSGISFASKTGLTQEAPVGEGMVLDFVVEKDGWYWLEVTGGLYTGGSVGNVFVDNSYMGTIDFGSGNGGPYSAYAAMNTVYLTAGVHRVELLTAKEGTSYLGKLNFYASDAPGDLTVTAAAREILLVGETAGAEVSAFTENGRAQSLLAVSEAPDFTNYYILTTSAPDVLAVEGKTLTARAAGTAEVTLTGLWQEQTVTSSFTVTVEEGTVASASLTAEETTLKPGADPVQLTFAAYGIGGGEVAAGTPVYATDNEAVAAVSDTGLVTVGQTEGSAKITATVMDGTRTVEASLWITVTAGKTEPTVYTYEERANAIENANTYDWAISMKNTAMAKADLYVENLDLIYDMWIREGIPRSTRVGLLYTGEAYRYCRYCGEDLVSTYGVYPWIVDPIENPWKITCPACDRDFPSNDFESYYKSGLDAQGYFHADLADESYLVNELYPEMGEGWGVDAGPGYYSGVITVDGREDVQTYIAYYLHCVFCSIGSSKNAMHTILDTLREAYLYTGDEKYGNAGAILIDRAADIYPEYDRGSFSTAYSNADGSSSFGKFVGCIWEAETIGVSLATAADAFWPCMENDEVVEYLRAKADIKGMAAEDITPEQIRENVNSGVLLEIKRACESTDMSGNFGMQQSAIAYAAVALDREPETGEMIDWAFRYGERTLENGEYSSDGGAVMYHLIDLVDRDGFGNEVSYQYNALWCDNLLDLADALKGYTSEYDLWSNPKFVNMFSAMSRYTVCGRLTPQAGEAGFVQSTHNVQSVSKLTTAFAATGNRELARALFAANGNTTKGLHADIFTADPEGGLQEQIRLIVNADGVWDHSQSNMMSGFGIAILREGPETYEVGVNEQEFSDYWMYFGKTGGSGHAQLEALTIDLEAFGLGLSSSMGYPLVVAASDAERMQWVRNTVSHNTVVVNDKGQSELVYGGFPLHFEDAGRVKLMDAEASNAYPETDIYRRTLVTVAAENGVHYAVDFFRVLGGSEHVYSFHGATTLEPMVEGLDLVEQPMGTYAGPGVPYGEYREVDSSDPSLNMGSGYSWLDHVSRDADPETVFSVDFAIEDFQDYVPDSEGIRMKFTMLSDEPMTEVAIADGHPPQNGRNPEALKYLLVRRSGQDGMDTLFTSIIEPYQDTALIASAELVAVEPVEGTETVTDRAAAMKLTLTGGRVDYVVYATNPDCLYSIDGGKFNFQGFTGVASYENDVMTYSWGSEVTTLGTAITEAAASVTGTVQSFTEGLADNYALTVTMEEAVTAEELEGRYIFVENDGQRNAAYRIYGAEVEGDTAILDLHTQTLIRGYVDKENMGKGYVYNLSAGDSYTIPLSSEGTCTHRNSVTYTCSGDGTHVVIRTCIYCGRVTSTSTAACKDGTDTDANCDRCKQPLPIQISTAEELIAFAEQVNGGDNKINAILTADIDLTGFAWTPIGTAGYPYKGVFTGGGHTVSGMQLAYRGGGESYRLGLFGTLSGAAVRGLTVEGSIALSGVPSSESAVGSLAGYAQNAVIEDCVSYVTVTGEAGVEGYHNLGGLVGYASGLTMTRCGNEGSLSALGYNMGGLVGYADSASAATRISESYNHGDIEGCKYLGGLVGTLCGGAAAAAPNVVTDCYNSGNFTTYDTLGNANASGGGLVGRAVYAYIKVKNAYISGKTAGGDLAVAGTVGTETKDAFDNIYYLEGAAAEQTLGKSISSEELCGAEFAAILGGAFKQAADRGPVLTWECAHEGSSQSCFDNGDGTHNVTFTCGECGLTQIDVENCTDADGDEACDLCGGLLSVDEFTFAGSNMTLGNELHLNFLFAKDQLDAGQSYTAVLTKYDGDGNVEETTNVASADWSVYAGGYYKVTAAVASGQMCDEISITILDEAGEQVGETYTDSVRGYAMRMLAKDLADSVKTMLVDMLNYGTEAQLVFGYNTDDLANAQLTDEQKALATASVTYEDSRENIKNAYGSNLSLVDRIKLGVYFYDMPADTTGMYGTVTFTRHNGDVVSEALTADDLQSFNTTAVKNLCQVVIDQIVLADARVPVTVTVYNADGTVYGSVVDSVEGYIARNSVKLAAQKSLYEAILKFADSAYGYFMNR